MKITFKGDYALKAILDLSFHFQSNKVIPLTDISKRNDIPLKFLEQIMLLLKNAGYVESKRGIGGGFILAKPPEDVTLGEIIRLIEGTIEPISCKNDNSASFCNDIKTCAFREIFVKVTDAISQIVDHVTFADMMKRTKELQTQNSAYMYQI